MIRVDWGDAIVDRLVPQRPPFRFVAAIRAVALGDAPALWATLPVEAADPLLAGHFPGEPIYPGALLIEAMAQTAAALGTLIELGVDASMDADALTARVFAAGSGPTALTLGGSVAAKFLAPVRPPAALDVEARLVRRLGHTWRFEAKVRLGRGEVANATLNGARWSR